MEQIVLPEKIVLNLIDSGGKPFRLPNVLFAIEVFANQKNDFQLGPYVTDQDGRATIRKADLLADAAAHYDTGLMDYHSIEESKPGVSIFVMTQEAIGKALEARTTVWTRLLCGEAARWGSLENLRNAYRSATNHRISAMPVTVQWDGRSDTYEYSFEVRPR